MTRARAPHAALLTTAMMASFIGCDPPEAPVPGDGVDLPDGACGHGLYVISTDYSSTSVSVVRWDGSVASAGILSSGSEAPGLSVALSGDVVAPTSRVVHGEPFLLDRYPASVITRFDPRGPTVTGQISVQTGFASNPQDVIEVDDGRLYVSRYERNADAGSEPFDAGSDVVIARAADGSLMGRVDLAPSMEGEAPLLLPRPLRMVRVLGGDVVVLLNPSSANFMVNGDARLVRVDPRTDAIRSFVRLAGARGCAGLAVAPSGARVALTCSGTFGGSSVPSLDGAAVVVVDVEATGLAEVRRFASSELGDRPLGFSATFASERTLLSTTLGQLAASGVDEIDDTLFELDLESGELRDLLRSAGAPFTLGDVRCEPACGVCFAADAGRGGVLHRFELKDGRTGPRNQVLVDDGTGRLFPRYLGAY